MRQPPSPSEVLADLIRIPSETPHVGAVFDFVEHFLVPIGFTIDRTVFSAPDTVGVENMLASTGTGQPHLALVGHVDVVPSGDPSTWRHHPLSAEIEDGFMYGRGAVDMKGGLAAMLVAVNRFLADQGPDFDGRISFLITGDEEGPAVNGMARLLHRAIERGVVFDAAIVGEPTSVNSLGDHIKIGRRGSYSATLTIEGQAGHSAYPQHADNAVDGLVAILTQLRRPYDGGSANFEPSTLEIVSLEAGTSVWNIIPGVARARMNGRFNDMWTRETFREEIRSRIQSAAEDPALGRNLPLRWRLEEEPSNSDVFLTEDVAFIDMISKAVESRTGKFPALSTGGGTSDARFFRNLCPVVEVGLVGTTMHQCDERVSLHDLDRVTEIYSHILEAYFVTTGVSE